MRILIVSEELTYRGTPKTVANYARILASNHEILVWGWRKGGETAETLRQEGFKVVTGEDGLAIALAFNPHVLNFHRDGRGYEKEWEILRRFRKNGTWCVETSVFGLVDPMSNKLIDVSLQISRWELYRWNAWGGGRRTIGVLCPNPVDTKSFRKAAAPDILKKRVFWGLPTDKAETCFVIGRIGNTSCKLIEAPIITVLDANPDMHLIHVNDSAGELPDRMARHPQIHCQTLMLNTEDLSLFYSSCDVCLSISTTGESFGMANAESMACSTPVIALSRPLNGNTQLEMVQNNHCGIAIADVSVLPHVLESLAHNKTQLAVMRENARKLIESRYSFATVGQVLETVLACLNSESLSRAFKDSSDRGALITEVPRSEILENVKDVYGHYKRGVLLIMSFLHTIHGYRCLMIFWAIKRFLARRPWFQLLEGRPCH